MAVSGSPKHIRQSGMNEERVGFVCVLRQETLAYNL